MSDLRHFRFGDYDKKITKMLRANGLLEDRRSKVVHDLSDTPHLLLFGQDMTKQRYKVSAKAGIGIADWGHYEMDHKQGGTSGRCDCQHNLQFLTREEHEAKHGRTIRSAKVTA